MLYQLAMAVWVRWYLEKTMEVYNVTRDVAKELFIILIYGGTFETWKEENDVQGEEVDEIVEFSRELQKEIMPAVRRANPDLVAEIEKNNTNFNV